MNPPTSAFRCKDYGCVFRLKLEVEFPFARIASIVGNTSLRSGQDISEKYRSDLNGHDMRKGWNLPLGFLNFFAFGALYCYRNAWTLAFVCLTSFIYLGMLKFTSADD